MEAGNSLATVPGALYKRSTWQYYEAATECVEGGGAAALKVLRLSTQDIAGGAPRASYWLHTGLCRLNEDSSMLADLHKNNNANCAASNLLIHLNRVMIYDRNQYDFTHSLEG